MSEHLTPAQTNFVWDQFRAGGHNGLSDAQIEALFDTIDRLRAERRVTKGLHAKIDEQAATIVAQESGRQRLVHALKGYIARADKHAATIQRVRELACSWMLEHEEAEYTEPELLALDNAAYEIIDELNDGDQGMPDGT